MTSNSVHSLLDEALGLNDGVSNGSAGGGGGGGSGAVLLIEDCVETSGAFILHQLIKGALSPHRPDDVVVLLAFAHPISHYDRILRKMGCNLVVQRDNQRFIYHDMLMVNYPDKDSENARTDMLLALYGRVQKTVELCSLSYGKKNITIMIDDISLVEVAASGSSNHVSDFLHYLFSLTTQFGCSVVILNHHDVYSSMEPSLLLQMEYLANVVIKAEPLATGLATDVHGQLTVFNRGACLGFGTSKGMIRNFHFRVKENNVEYFHPGSRA